MYKSKPLKYSYSSLEPFIDSETINIHYNKHYLNYLNKLNDLLISLNYDFRYNIYELIDNIEIFSVDKRDDILFLVGGVINHELYFDSIGPSNHKPYGKILDKINQEYGSYNNFLKEFKKNAQVLVGSGYTSLVLNRSGNLEIINTSNQETPLLYGLKPILTLDLWEHAYYLKYQNRKDLYIDAFFNIIDFDSLNNRYEKQ
ncbi:MAG: superoxide dismutase [Firmicutes bacterium]|nr:superoxide dismutase [Bacillota bacterium]